MTDSLMRCCSAQQRLYCERCTRTFAANDTYSDLTLEAVGTDFQDKYWGGTEIFRYVYGSSAGITGCYVARHSSLFDASVPVQWQHF